MTTRICVKGLPKSADDAAVRSHFAARFGAAALTDARVVRTRAGSSRCFGFVGFKTEADAAAAVAWFDKSYMGAARLAVEAAQPVGGAALGRPWSKHTKAKLEEAGASGGGGGGGGRDRGDRPRSAAPARAGAALPDDPRFDEFVALHKRRAAVPLWANDDATAAAGAAAPTERAKPKRRPAKQAKNAADAADSDGDAVVAASSDDEDLYEDMTGGPGAASDGGGSDDDGGDRAADPAVADAGVSDADYLKSRTVAALSSDDEEEDAASGSDDDGALAAVPTPAAAPPPRAAAPSTDAPAPAPGRSAPVVVDAGDLGAGGGGGDGRATAPSDPAAAAAADAGPPTNRLFLRNLPYATTEADLEAALGVYGGVREVKIVTDRVSRASRGLAIATLDTAAAAAAARAALDGSIFQGRLLHVLPGQPVPEAAPADRDGERGGGTFKAARDAARRAGAGSAADRAAWSALFVRADTVAAAVAAHFGVSKADLLARDADDVAVRVALGEAHVLAATKAALAAAGVDVAALEAAAAAPRKRGRAGAGPAAAGGGPPRSATTLLVKNLAHATTDAELTTLFAPHGAIARLVLPPSRALAVVEYACADAARAALRACAYRRLHSVPLYLEWAPADVWTTLAPAGGVAVAAAGAGDAAAAPAAAPRAAAVAAAAAARAAAPDDDAAAADGGTSLFVKNLSFATDDADLAAHFAALAKRAGLPAGAVRAARVARRARPAGAPPAAPPPSAGYGFVEAASEEAAAALAAAGAGSRLGGHALVVERAAAKRRAGAAAPAPAAAAAPGAVDDARTKLIVRNVAFQAARGDVAALFAPFGAVKSVRLPKKASLDGAHRGYAFVDFASHEEAAAALAGVAGAHLYGRRLGLEWADADGEAGVDALTARAAAGFKKQRA